MKKIGGYFGSWGVAVAVLSALLVVGGCDSGRASGAADPRLSGGPSSLDSLGSRVWAAIAARDTVVLETLRLSEHEHNEHVWPEQPAAANASANEALDYWWQNVEVRNEAAVADLLDAHGGSDARLVDTRCEGGPRGYASYRALTECYLLTKDRAGDEREVRAFRYVVEMDGEFKAVRYYGRE